MIPMWIPLITEWTNIPATLVEVLASHVLPEGRQTITLMGRWVGVGASVGVDGSWLVLSKVTLECPLL